MIGPDGQSEGFNRIDPDLWEHLPPEACFGLGIYTFMGIGIKKFVKLIPHSISKSRKNDQLVSAFATELDAVNGNIIGTLLNTELEGDEWASH